MLSANSSVSWTKKHSLLSKWNLLFDKSPEWIAFKPQLGLKVYPCYSCKNMFSSKLTFQDHINRRVIIIKYKCTFCTNTFTFYNRCSFLLHTRKHFTLGEGQINLANVDISILPVELAGFARHESVPFLYDEEEEYSNDNTYINCQFYTPDDSEAGKQTITLRPFNLVFHYAEGGNNILLVLKQISINVPLCEFMTQGYDKQKPIEIETSNENAEPEIKRELEIEEFSLPVIAKIESLNESEQKKHPSCPECLVNQEMPMAAHFLGNNKPIDESLCCYVCKYVAPTKCSLRAHIRTHESGSPFVCPECGKVFKSSTSLNTHMEDVCFHLSKSVRFRCPAQKCGKLFVLPNTYASHFNNHLQSIIKCNTCNLTFFNDEDFNEHTKTREACTVTKTYNCLVCKNIPTLISEDKCAEHVNWHLQDRERCVYIFTCKLCRSYFRSTATYSVHKQRCAKGEKVYPIIMTSNCHSCGQKIIFREKDNYRTCSNCKQVNHFPKSSPPLDEKKSTCMLCKEEISESEEEHSKICKYNNPIVTIQVLSNESKESDETNSSNDINTSNSDIESKPSMDTSNDSLKSDDTKKKRKRSSVGNTKSKKVATEDTTDLQAEKPVCFDGTYYCKLCDYKNTDRAEFHGHIIEHRDVSTSYQCMECGECFVVKPSLIKHLTHYHKITDTDSYLMKNDCYDKFAIEELEHNQKLVPGEYKGPVGENQCSVCLEQFEDSLSLDKHFRIHGMAFLMKKTK